MSLQRNSMAVRGFRLSIRAVAGLQRLVAQLLPAPFRLIQMGSAFWLSRALDVATRLDIASQLGDDTLAVGELAGRLQVSPDALARLLRLLVASGVFAEPQRGCFCNSSTSAWLRQDHPRSVRAMVLLHNSRAMSAPWYWQLEEGIRQGVPPFVLSHGQELFERLNADAPFDALFSAAMDSVEALAGDSFTTDMDWQRVDRIIDVGGSRGRKSLALLRRHGHLRACVVDRPGVVAEALRYWCEHPEPALDRLQFVAGDLFEMLPEAQDEGDLYLLSAVLHGFGETDCLKGLATLRRAIGQSGARVVLMEMVLADDRPDLPGALCDMQMFMAGQGRERTLDEWRTLCLRGGFQIEEVVETRSLAKLLVLRLAQQG